MRSFSDFLSLLLVLALMLGTAQHLALSAEMQRGAPASNLAMSAMESGMSMSGLCDRCVKKGPTMHACFGACVGAQVIAPSIGFAPIWAEAIAALFIEQLFSGSSTPPDLPPPKLTVLS